MRYIIHVDTKMHILDNSGLSHKMFKIVRGNGITDTRHYKGLGYMERNSADGNKGE